MSNWKTSEEYVEENYGATHARNSPIRLAAKLGFERGVSSVDARVQSLQEENKRLRLELGQSEGIRAALEEASLTKAHRALWAEANIYCRERDEAKAELAALKKEIEDAPALYKTTGEAIEWWPNYTEGDTHTCRAVRIEEIKK